MLNRDDKPIPGHEELAAMARVTLAEHRRVLQLTLATLAATQIAIEKLEERRRQRVRA